MTDGKATPPAADEPEATALSRPEASFKLATPTLGASSAAEAAGRLYGIGGDVYRSDDAGVSWVNLTSYKGVCLLGPGLRAVAASPLDPDDVVVASDTGVWRSLDGGVSWSGLNQFLPNLPAGHLIGIAERNARSAAGAGGCARGARSGVGAGRENGVEADGRGRCGARAESEKRAIAGVEAFGHRDRGGGGLHLRGRQRGTSAGFRGRWRELGRRHFDWANRASPESSARWKRIWVDANDPRRGNSGAGRSSSVAAGSAKPAYVLRTMNGGSFWDDITANLPETAAAHGVAADRGERRDLCRDRRRVCFTPRRISESAGRPTVWSSLSEHLPAAAAVTDVKLDAGGNQLFAVLDGYGVYTAIAPHRLRDARIVNAADYSARPTAPGALLSVLGARVESARSAGCRGAGAGRHRDGFADPGAIRGHRQHRVAVARGGVRDA